MMHACRKHVNVCNDMLCAHVTWPTQPCPHHRPRWQAAAPGGRPCAPRLTGRISMVRNKLRHRNLDISLEYGAELSDGRAVSHTALYSMSVIT